MTDTLLLVRLEWAREYRRFYASKPAQYAYWSKVVSDMERMTDDEKQPGHHDHKRGLPGLRAACAGRGQAGRQAGGNALLPLRPGAVRDRDGGRLDENKREYGKSK